MNVTEQLAVITAAENENETAFCKNCGGKLEHTPGRKPKKFCSDKCRMAWWYKKRRSGADQNAEGNGMTLRQKHSIRILRNLGFGYQKIANDLSLKKHQVRDYCRYHGLTGNAKQNMISVLESRFGRDTDSCTVKNYCWFCGNETKLTRKFCCDKCRYAYNYKRRTGKT